jgi:hypothetical protein
MTTYIDILLNTLIIILIIIIHSIFYNSIIKCNFTDKSDFYKEFDYVFITFFISGVLLIFFMKDNNKTLNIFDISILFICNFIFNTTLLLLSSKYYRKAKKFYKNIIIEQNFKPFSDIAKNGSQIMFNNFKNHKKKIIKKNLDDTDDEDEIIINENKQMQLIAYNLISDYNKNYLQLNQTDILLLLIYNIIFVLFGIASFYIHQLLIVSGVSATFFVFYLLLKYIEGIPFNCIIGF